MTRHPWLKFYPSDWQADERLGMCSLAARGLWMEMLALMHKAYPYGHLLVYGKAPTDTQLASLARCPQDQIPSLLDELESAGVFSRTRTGLIYSRRLTRDEKRRSDGDKAAISGTNIPGSRRSQRIEKHKQKRPPPRVAGGVTERPPPHPDTRSQIPERTPKPPTEPEPSAGAGEDLVKRMAGVLDDAVRRHYPGHSRAPHHSDRPIAEGWIERGVTPEFLAEVIDGVLTQRAKSGGDAPGLLKFFLGPVDRAIAARGGKPPPPPDPEREAAARRYTQAVRQWSADGKQGPAPKPAEFGYVPDASAA